MCVVGGYSCGQFVPWRVCWGLQEVECALLFSFPVQRRAAWRFPDAGPAAGLRYCSDVCHIVHSVSVQVHTKKTECTYTSC